MSVDRVLVDSGSGRREWRCPRLSMTSGPVMASGVEATTEVVDLREEPCFMTALRTAESSLSYAPQPPSICRAIRSTTSSIVRSEVSMKV